MIALSEPRLQDWRRASERKREWKRREEKASKEKEIIESVADRAALVMLVLHTECLGLRIWKLPSSVWHHLERSNQEIPA